MQFERMEPWEGLDIDDSDLKAFLKKCNSTATLIPGPTANVQAAMLNRQTDEPKSTQEFVNDIAKATFDRDFKSNPWIWAEKFIKHHGLVEDGNINNVTQLERVKSMHVLPFVACIVKECNPNGLGDMKIVVKVGALSPFGRIYYLNITVRNIVKPFLRPLPSGHSSSVVAEDARSALLSTSTRSRRSSSVVPEDARPQSFLPPIAQDGRPRWSLRTLVRTPSYLHSVRTLVLARRSGRSSALLLTSTRSGRSSSIRSLNCVCPPFSFVHPAPPFELGRR
ncbi:hypothetical protein LR48_Vigan11g094500 [Vigna angularis]|uniref:Uncharacterized protein n=1 Tax=Phaseolus angularis TaxID=3914 RepID=A0A0L9VSR9_PHAAN|nr:hypothetical protein LR48_Vigan11g094500 [Vigna angularis]